MDNLVEALFGGGETRTKPKRRNSVRRERRMSQGKTKKTMKTTKERTKRKSRKERKQRRERRLSRSRSQRTVKRGPMKGEPCECKHKGDEPSP